MPTSFSTLCSWGLFIPNFSAMYKHLWSLTKPKDACTLTETLVPKIKIQYKCIFYMGTYNILISDKIYFSFDMMVVK